MLARLGWSSGSLLLAMLLLTTLLVLLTCPWEVEARGRRLKRQHIEDRNDSDVTPLHQQQQRRHHNGGANRRRQPSSLHRRRRGRRQQEGRNNDSISIDATSQPTIIIPTPVRHEDSLGTDGIAVGEAASPPECPPPIQPFSRDLCSAPACLHHHQCHEGRACCFNGCLHTCLLQVERPPVFDWIEDTNAILPILDEFAPPQLPVRYEDQLSYAEGREEAVHLPGGCTISGSQYSQLQKFMTAPSIENCMCEQGEVVCAVKMFQS